MAEFTAREERDAAGSMLDGPASGCFARRHPAHRALRCMPELHSLLEDSAHGSREKRELVLERIAPDGASLTRVVTLPSGCWADEIGAGGTLVACTILRYTPDVWLADRAGKSGW